MPNLNNEVRYVKGIGEKKAKLLEKLGICTLADLVTFYPRAYEDRTAYKPIGLLMPDESVCVRATVTSTPRTAHIRKGMDITKLRVCDDSGALDITYFNRSYIKDQLRAGETYVFYGKAEVLGAKRAMANPVFERDGADGEVTGCIVPVYRLTQGISQKVMMNAVRQGLSACAEELPDPLPADIRERFMLCQARYAYENIHFPSDLSALDVARRRLVFEELFVLACSFGMLRRCRVDEAGIRFTYFDTEQFYSSLPFEPTGAQRRAVAEAAEDMRSGRPMNRLVQGDVGSGKTLVAAACVWQAWKNGRQCAFMAPTEILTEQHLNTFSAFLAPLGIRVGRLTGSMTAKEKREVKASLASGELDLVIGTVALLTEDVEFRDLALVITDEQHRFGVEQRAALTGKGARPHVLVMSATPIPRTLALIIYGDLDVSVIDELPPGRQKVDTFAVDESYRDRLNGFIRKQAQEGRQTFIVCPMIEENDELPMDLKPAQTHAQELRLVFPELRVECIHGKMKAKDKEAVMSAFASGGIDVLVSTTVVEVGVDVPNASLMVIENAERFGLSQLHQLRGRVGRGQYKSWCIMVSDARGEEAQARLKAMTQTSDGFKISEEDLKLRGPGDFFGSRQHGLPELHIADMGADMSVLQTAQRAGASLLDEDPELTLPGHAGLRAACERLIASTGGRFN